MTELEKWFAGQPELMMFDLDGTLVDSVADVAAAVDRMRREMNLPEPGLDKVRNWVGRGAEALLDKVMADCPGQPALRQEAGERFACAYSEAVHVHSRLFEGVDAALKLFSTWCPLVCITNKPWRYTQPLLASLGIDERFALILAGDSLLHKKPHALPVLHTLHHFGVQPERALMVGDSRNDVIAAHAAGVRCIALTWGYNHGEPIEDCSPDWIVDAFADLL